MNQYFTHGIRFCILSALLFVILPFGCKDSDPIIPWVEVKLSIDLSVNNGLKVPSYSMKFNEAGYSGVIVLCWFYDYSAPTQSIYYAYDATCPNEISQDCSLVPEDNGIYATCPCCSTKFTLLGGYPVEGTSASNLKSYNTRLSGEKLWVYN